MEKKYQKTRPRSTSILHAAKVAGKDEAKIIEGAISEVGWSGTDKGRMTAAAMLRNLNVAEKTSPSLTASC